MRPSKYNSIIGNRDYYCGGYFESPSDCYVCGVTLETQTFQYKGRVRSTKLPTIIGFDLGERGSKLAPYLGQINMVRVSSFISPESFLWGYNIARSEKYQETSQNKILELKSGIPVYNGNELVHATTELLGSISEPHFPIFPGSIVPCVYDMFHKKKKAGKFYAAIAFGIPITEEQEEKAIIIMQNTGALQIHESLDHANRDIADSVSTIADFHKIELQKIIVCSKSGKVQKNQYGTAFCAVPYIHLAKEAVPDQTNIDLEKLSLSEWKKLVEEKFICNR